MVVKKPNKLSNKRKTKLFLIIFIIATIILITGSFSVRFYRELFPGSYEQIASDPIIYIVFDDAELLSRQDQKRGFYGIDHPYNPPNIRLWYGTNNSIKEVESFYLREFEKTSWQFNVRSDYDSPISSNISSLNFLKNGGCGKKEGSCGNLTFLKGDVELVKPNNGGFEKVDKKGYSNIYEIKLTSSKE